MRRRNPVHALPSLLYSGEGNVQSDPIKFPPAIRNPTDNVYMTAHLTNAWSQALRALSGYRCTKTDLQVITFMHA